MFVVTGNTCTQILGGLKWSCGENNLVEEGAPSLI